MSLGCCFNPPDVDSLALFTYTRHRINFWDQHSKTAYSVILTDRSIIRMAAQRGDLKHNGFQTMRYLFSTLHVLEVSYLWYKFWSVSWRIYIQMYQRLNPKPSELQLRVSFNTRFPPQRYAYVVVTWIAPLSCEMKI